MDFSLNEEQQLLKDSLRRFTKQHVKWNDAAQKGIDHSIWRKLGDIGALALGLPEHLDGTGGREEIVIVCEELGRASSRLPFASSAILAGQLIAQLGSEVQHQALLPKMIVGELIISVAYSEEHTQGLVDGARTQARATSSGFVLSGRKTLVLAASTADMIIVSARMPDPRNGLGLFVVPSVTEGLHKISTPLVDGTDAADIILDNVAVSADAMLGQDHGSNGLQRALALALLASCAEAVGSAARTVEISSEYLKTRTQFGQRIGDFQALQHRIADMIVKTEMAKASLLAALAANQEPGSSHFASKISAAKYMIGRASRDVSAAAIQLHGGMGMTDEIEVGRHFQRANVLEALFGNGMLHLQHVKDVTEADGGHAFLALG